MEIPEPIVRSVAADLTALDADDAGWFAVRQPGILRYLEARCHDDLLGVALAGSMAIHRMYERALGRAPRLGSHEVEHAEQALLAGDSQLTRQPAVGSFIAQLVMSPPIMLTLGDVDRLGLVLVSVMGAYESTILDDVLS
jgi:hypothetical protein